MSLRTKVLGCYRIIHRTAQQVFAGDLEAINEGRLRIKNGFLANRHLKEHSEILEQIKIAEETSTFMKQAIIQGKFSTEKNAYELKISKDTYLHDNIPLKEEHVIDLNDYKVPDKYKKT